uniref:Uncharacterized protein n=1 Tax=mine drainage metagenome TaxID=410659 RepID=E6PXE3_9ZZZZ
MRSQAKVRIAHGSAAGDVAARIGRLDHLSRLEHNVGMGRAEFRGKPTFQSARNDGRKPFATDKINAGIPVCQLAKPGRSIGQHQLMKAIRRVQPKPQTHRAAHRKPAKSRLRYLQSIEQREDIEAKRFYAYRAVWNRRSTVTTRIQAQHPKVSAQTGNDLLPHGEAHAERVSQHQHGGAGFAAQIVVQFRIWQMDKRHGLRALALEACGVVAAVAIGFVGRCAATANRGCRVVGQGLLLCILHRQRAVGDQWAVGDHGHGQWRGGRRRGNFGRGNCFASIHESRCSMSAVAERLFGRGSAAAEGRLGLAQFLTVQRLDFQLTRGDKWSIRRGKSDIGRQHDFVRFAHLNPSSFQCSASLARQKNGQWRARSVTAR